MGLSSCLRWSFVEDARMTRACGFALEERRGGKDEKDRGGVEEEEEAEPALLVERDRGAKSGIID